MDGEGSVGQRDGGEWGRERGRGREIEGREREGERANSTFIEDM